MIGDWENYIVDYDDTGISFANYLCYCNCFFKFTQAYYLFVFV